MFREVTRLPELEKDLKKLLKRYPSLEEDLDNFIKFGMVPYHKLGEDNGGIVRIPGLGFDQPKIFKARKFACCSLKGKGVQSGIRVIYVYFDEEDRIELIEIYYPDKGSLRDKGDKENEDRKRIMKYYI